MDFSWAFDYFMKWLANQHFRLNLGAMWAMPIQMLLISVSASKDISQFLGWQQRTTFVLMSIAGPLAIWLLGWVMDKSGYAIAYQDQANDRNSWNKTIALGREALGGEPISGELRQVKDLSEMRRLGAESGARLNAALKSGAGILLIVLTFSGCAHQTAYQREAAAPKRWMPPECR